jgi:hypothetical protein
MASHVTKCFAIHLCYFEQRHTAVISMKSTGLLVICKVLEWYLKEEYRSLQM